jgi:hypothetical protein
LAAASLNASFASKQNYSAALTTLAGGSGSALTNLNASSVTAGTLAVAYGGTGGSSSTGSGSVVLATGPALTGTATAATLDAQTLLKGKGTATNDNAASGYIGEYVSANLSQASRIGISTNTAANIVSVTLTAGDWDCQGAVSFIPSGSVPSRYAGWISTASASEPTPPNGGAYSTDTGVVGSFGVGETRESVAGSTTVYLSSIANFSGGTMSTYGFLGCRRMR